MSVDVYMFLLRLLHVCWFASECVCRVMFVTRVIMALKITVGDKLYYYVNDLARDSQGYIPLSDVSAVKPTRGIFTSTFPGRALSFAANCHVQWALIYLPLHEYGICKLAQKLKKSMYFSALL